MNESLQPFASPMDLPIGATLFAVLLTVILTTLRRAGMFSPGASLVLAICASLLAVIGIVCAFSPAEDGTEAGRNGNGLDALLLPYTAMGIAILLVLSLLLVRKLFSAKGKAFRRPKQQIRAKARRFGGTDYENRRSNGTLG